MQPIPTEQLSQENYNPFHNIPKKKLSFSINEINKLFKNNPIVAGKLIEITNRYYIANIPVDYWEREMTDFQGPKILKNRYDNIIKSLDDSYKKGIGYCFAGGHGTGKTMAASNILKRAVETGNYSALYVNLTDVVSVLLSGDSVLARKYLIETDFLVIDEIDPRFMGSENAADLFGRLLEPIIRTRIQNRLPIIICTNSTDMTSSFSGPLRASLNSLMKVVKLTAAPGKDRRGEIK
jgi:DNA replication protein DnaC